MTPDVFRLNILPRLAVSHYVQPDPGHVDLSKLQRKWYFRPLWRLLCKLGAEYQERIPASWPVQEVQIDHSDVIALIGGSKKALSLLWDKKATTLIVGHDEMDKLMRDAPTEMLTFNMQFPLVNNREYRLMGLRVVCVP